MKSLRILLALTISSLSLLSLTSCATNSGTGALIGGAGGAAVGAAVDKNDRGRGAVIGGAAGAVTGAIIGNEQDKRDREARRYYRGY